MKKTFPESELHAVKKPLKPIFSLVGIVMMGVLMACCTGSGISEDATDVDLETSSAVETSPDGEAEAEVELSNEVQPKPEAATAQVRLGLRQETEIDGLQLIWLSIEDSRCPTGVECVWAGNVTAEIKLTLPTGESEIVKLIHPIRGGDKPAPVLGHWLNLLGVDPYPKYGQEIAESEYVARLEVTPEAN